MLSQPRTLTRTTCPGHVWRTVPQLPLLRPSSNSVSSSSSIVCQAHCWRKYVRSHGTVELQCTCSPFPPLGYNSRTSLFVIGEACVLPHFLQQRLQRTFSYVDHDEMYHLHFAGGNVLAAPPETSVRCHALFMHPNYRSYEIFELVMCSRLPGHKACGWVRSDDAKTKRF